MIQLGLHSVSQSIVLVGSIIVIENLNLLMSIVICCVVLILHNIVLYSFVQNGFVLSLEHTTSFAGIATELELQEALLFKMKIFNSTIKSKVWDGIDNALPLLKTIYEKFEGAKQLKWNYNHSALLFDLCRNLNLVEKQETLKFVVDTLGCKINDRDQVMLELFFVAMLKL